MRMYLPKFQLICEAYEVLSNSQLKAIYETYGEEVLRQGILGPDGGTSVAFFLTYFCSQAQRVCVLRELLRDL